MQEADVALPSLIECKELACAVTATAALEKLGMVPHDELHHPGCSTGMLAAAAALGVLSA
eukprot:397245-Pelagomonas_calceolata.AAC.4